MEISSSLTGLTLVERRRGNLRLALRLGLVALAFGAFGFAMVPLYDVICRLTGLNGKTSAVAAVVDSNTQVDFSRSVKVEFLSHTMPGVALTFQPEVFTLRVHPGEISRVNYTVTNNSDKVYVGQAVPSVTPAVASRYFEKLECFCFRQQTFQPRETRVMPVVYVVNPKLDPDLGTITLSYTFFEAPKAKS